MAPLEHEARDNRTQPDLQGWSAFGLAATELYSHKGDTGLGKAAFDDFENQNEAHDESNAAVVAALHKRLAAQFSKNSGCAPPDGE